MKQIFLSINQSYLNKPVLPKFIVYLFKLVLGAVLLYFLLRQLGGYAHLFADLQHIVAQWSFTNWVMMASIFVLSGFNWATEAYKWQLLMQKVLPISYRLAIRSVLVGTSLAIVTPNRLGEYGGRVALLPSHRWQAMAVTFRANFSQLIINLVVGAVAFGTYCAWFMSLQITPIPYFLLWMCIGITTLALLFFYYKTPLVSQYLQRFTYLQRWQSQYNNMQKYNFVELNKALALSFLRWAIFTLQYTLLLWVFGLQVAYLPLIITIGSIYFVQTLLPAITFIEIGVRGNTALFFLGALSTQKTAILLASFGLWGINLLIPALLGTLIMMLNKEKDL